MYVEKIGKRPELAALFLLLLEWALSLLSRFFSGWLGSLLHYASYVLPLLLFLLLLSTREELMAHRPTKKGLRRVLPLLPIFLASVLPDSNIATIPVPVHKSTTRFFLFIFFAKFARRTASKYGRYFSTASGISIVEGLPYLAIGTQPSAITASGMMG